MFCKKGVHKNFVKFTNTCARDSFLTLLKESLWHSCFPVNFAKFLRTPFLTEHLWWLLLKLELAQVQTGQILDRLFGVDKIISEYCVFIAISNDKIIF